MLRTSFNIGGIEIDMTLWRLVFFGVVLMLTLRFARNGLLVPVINYFSRGHVAAETVVQRRQSVSSEGASTAPGGQGGSS